MAGVLLALAGLFAGGVDTGWTFYTPLSTSYAKGYVVLVCCGIILSGYSSIATGLNFIITIHQPRPPGMGWYQLPLFLWSRYSVSVLYVLATPVLAMLLVLLLFERLFQIGAFGASLGGDPLLFQHLFWFYSHPAVYIMILPGFGVVSEVITTFSRKKIFGYEFIAWSSVSIAVISFFVWGHHHYCPVHCERTVSKHLIHSGFLAILGGVDLKLATVSPTLFRGGPAHERRKDAVLSVDGLPALEHVHTARCALRWRPGSANVSMRRAVPCHGVRTAYLSRKPTRH